MACLIIFIAFWFLPFLILFYLTISVNGINLGDITQEEIDYYLFHKELRYDSIY